MQGQKKTCNEDHAGRVVGQDCKGTQESARACKAGGCKKCNEWGGAGAQRHTWTEGWKGCGIQRARDAGMQGNAFMEDGAGKVDA
jgi:hypothetical protein